MRSTSLLGSAIAASSAFTVRGNPLGSYEAGFGIDLAAAGVVAERALADSPKGYTPADINCPSERPVIRAATHVSPSESTWLKTRQSVIIDPMRDLLGRLNISGLDTNAYIDNNKGTAGALPVIGVAISGGGYRAMLNGAGAIAAMDSRTNNSTSKGHIGGLLQSATYLAGLSGGSWLVGSLYVNNFTTVQSLISAPAKQSATGDLWDFANSILKGPTDGIISAAKYYLDIYNAVHAKEQAGFNTTITDYWGRALSYQLVNATDGGEAYTWSSIADTPDFNKAQMPLPIIVSDGRAPGEILISLNTTVYEFNPWEMGSFDPQLFGFAPLRYVGSNFTHGQLSDSQPCVRGFDNAGYIMGTSSTLFNQFLLNIGSVSGVPTFLKDAITNLLLKLGNAQEDIADWSPNPFYQWNMQANPAAVGTGLTLVDGGEDGQNVPLHPLIQPERHVDVIFAVDSSADTVGVGAGWPNGTSLVATYQRAQEKVIQNGTAFPAIPDQNTFVNLGLNTRPTFFGCNASNMTGTNTGPIVVYLPNAPYIFDSNITTFTLEYNDTTRDNMVSNGYLMATMGNSTLDSMWPTCLGCAVLSRSLARTKTKVPSVCTTCFTNYCWNGTVNSTTPNPYNPQLILPNFKAKTGAASGLIAPSVLALGIAWAVLGLLDL